METLFFSFSFLVELRLRSLARPERHEMHTHTMKGKRKNVYKIRSMTGKRCLPGVHQATAPRMKKPRKQRYEMYDKRMYNNKTHPENRLTLAS